MNRIIKGAVITTAGVALLLGGGGTLAVWNDTQNTAAGAIVAGNLDLVAGAGEWKNAAGTIIDVATYRVVPGDTLTYTQPLDVTLVGDLMKADLVVTGAGTSTFTAANITVGAVQLTNAAGAVLPTTVLTDSGAVTASTTFAFSPTATSDALKTYDFGAVGYQLEQIAP